VIKLGRGNDAAAREALAAWPGGLQLGGGVAADNAVAWLNAGAAKVIVTSWLFPGAFYAPERLEALERLVGRDRLVVDLSCRRVGPDWRVAIDRWRTITEFVLGPETVADVAAPCDALLVHAADAEGLAAGV